MRSTRLVLTLLALLTLLTLTAAACADDVDDVDDEPMPEPMPEERDPDDPADDPDDAADDDPDDAADAEDSPHGTVTVDGEARLVDGIRCEERVGYSDLQGETHQMAIADDHGGDWRIVYDPDADEVHTVRFDVGEDVDGERERYRASPVQIDFTHMESARGELTLDADGDLAEQQRPDGVDVALDVDC